MLLFNQSRRLFWRRFQLARRLSHTFTTAMATQMAEVREKNMTVTAQIICMMRSVEQVLL